MIPWFVLLKTRNLSGGSAGRLAERRLACGPLAQSRFTLKVLKDFARRLALSFPQIQHP